MILGYATWKCGRYQLSTFSASGLADLLTSRTFFISEKALLTTRPFEACGLNMLLTQMGPAILNSECSWLMRGLINFNSYTENISQYVSMDTNPWLYSTFDTRRIMVFKESDTALQVSLISSHYLYRYYM